MDCGRDKAGLAKVHHQLVEISNVDGAGNSLRGEAVIQVRGQSGRERYTGEQAKNKIDRVGPDHARPIAQGQLKSLDKKIG